MAEHMRLKFKGNNRITYTAYRDGITVFISHEKPTHIQVQSATVQPSQQASPQQQQTIIAQTQQQANLLQSPGQQLIWHNQRLYAIVPQGKIHIYESYIACVWKATKHTRHTV